MYQNANVQPRKNVHDVHVHWPKCSTATRHEFTVMNSVRTSVDEAAFGAIYGAITVMGVLGATRPDDLDPLLTAGSLFVTVMAVALAKAYADLASNTLTSAQPVDKDMIANSWRHSRTTLIAANGPTLAMLLSSAGFYDATMALALAQVLAIMVLLFYGARIGFKLTQRLMPTVFSAAFSGGIGIALSLLKNLWH